MEAFGNYIMLWEQVSKHCFFYYNSEGYPDLHYHSKEQKPETQLNLGNLQHMG